MTDLRSRKLIVAKGAMFLGIVVLAAYLLLAGRPLWPDAVLLAVLVWAACRFYYFLFYVLERYVDPSLRYAGLWALLEAIAKRRRDR